MKLTPNNELRDTLIAKLKEKYGKERPGIHVSDLIYCLREAYFRRINPQGLTETDLNFFLDGSERHQLMEQLSGCDTEVGIEWNGITGTIDLLNGAPAELKTTRAKETISPHYIKQLSYYVAMTNATRGTLLIQRINNRDAPFECYQLEWTREETDQIRREMEIKKQLLSKALAEKNPTNLPKPELDGQWKCNYCKNRRDCDANI